MNDSPFDSELAKLMVAQVLLDLSGDGDALRDVRSRERQEQPPSFAWMVSTVRKLFVRCMPAMKTLRLGVAHTLRLFF